MFARVCLSRRLALLCLFALAAVVAAAPRAAVADQAAPLVSATDARRVFVSGVPDRFDRVRAAVEKAKQQSGRDYRVIIVGESGGRQTAKTMLEAVIERWGREGATADGKTNGFDPARDYQAYAEDPRTRAWDELMRRYQRPAPFAAPGQWWTPLEAVFDLDWFPSRDGR
jgi:hypothetical protein